MWQFIERKNTYWKRAYTLFGSSIYIWIHRIFLRFNTNEFNKTKNKTPKTFHRSFVPTANGQNNTFYTGRWPNFIYLATGEWVYFVRMMVQLGFVLFCILFVCSSISLPLHCLLSHLFSFILFYFHIKPFELILLMRRRPLFGLPFPTVAIFRKRCFNWRWICLICMYIILYII